MKNPPSFEGTLPKFETNAKNGEEHAPGLKAAGHAMWKLVLDFLKWFDGFGVPKSFDRSRMDFEMNLFELGNFSSPNQPGKNREINWAGDAVWEVLPVPERPPGSGWLDFFMGVLVGMGIAFFIW